MRRFLPLLLVAAACASSKAEPGGSTESSIINGQASPTDDAVVLVVLPDSFCTGTLIAPNLLLTARHCVSAEPADECSPFGADRAPNTIGVALGEHPSSQKIVARGSKLFLETKSSICGQDIALVMLDQDVPGITPKKVRATAPVAGEMTTAIGYGEDENKQLKGRLQRANIAVQAVGPATKTAGTVTVNVPANDFMTGESVCHGDSGGPLFDSKGLVLGTTSRGTELGCVNAPAIFSSTAAHIELIKMAAKAAGHPLDTSSTDAGTDASDASADASADASRDASADASSDASSSTDASSDASEPAPPPSTSTKTPPANDEGDDDSAEEEDPSPRGGLSTVPSRSCAAAPLLAGDPPWTGIALALGATVWLARRRRRATPSL